MVRLSLRKFGYLLPVFATPDGEVLSGHQRLHETLAMGWTHVPVSVVDEKVPEKQKALNLIFNFATNDLPRDFTTRALWQGLQSKAEALALADATVPDVDDSPEQRYPCLYWEEVPLDTLLKVNSGRWVRGATNGGRNLIGRRICIPIVLQPDDLVVNGIGRLEAAAEAGFKTWPCVRLNKPPESIEAAKALLNLLSMDFDVQSKLADQLRHNSYLRPRIKSTSQNGGLYKKTDGERTLGKGKVFFVHKGGLEEFDTHDPATVSKWKTAHGEEVAEFGGGDGRDKQVLESMGVKVHCFEPYPVEPGTSDPNIEHARQQADAFLDFVAEGRPLKSVFLSAVLNSVPFREDRLKLCRLCAVIGGPAGKLFIAARPATSTAIKGLIRPYSNPTYAAGSQFLLDYEPNTVLGEITGDFKAQKFHSDTEMTDLLGEVFEKVVIMQYDDSNICAVGWKPKPLSASMLVEAATFEFDLPYPNDQRIGRGRRAAEVFELHARRNGLLQ